MRYALTGARRALAVVLLAVGVLVLRAPALSAQVQVSSPDGAEVPLSLSVTSGEWIGPDTPLRFQLNRALIPGRERLIVLLGRRDVTPLLVWSDEGAAYDPRTVPVAGGSHDLVAWLVVDGEGPREVARVAVRAEGRLGIRERGATQTLETGLKSRLGIDMDPAQAAGDRGTYQDVDGQLALGGRLAWRDAAVSSQLLLLGTSHRPSALRFGNRGERAPLVDLSSYLVQARRGGAEFSLGHLSTGGHRFLLNGFSSRGGTLRLAGRGGRAELAVSALHGSSLVGWDDALGFTDPGHRVVNTQVALEALPRPGALRVEVSAMNGSVLPISAFNQGAVVDAETSTGHGVRIQSAAFGQRLRLEAGAARSNFDLRADGQLGPLDSLVPVRRETRQARFVEASTDVLRALPLGGGRTASLTLGVAHERIDPLYRSVGSWIQSDRQQDRLDVRGSIAGVQVGAVAARSRNNLDDIPTILTSDTESSGGDVYVPVAQVFGVTGAWVPALRARLQRTHHAGRAVPVDGGFDPSHVPDQVSDDRTLAVEWQASRGSLALTGNRSRQDNRQPGRERADLDNTSLGAQLLVTPHRLVAFDANVMDTRAHSVERDETEEIRRIAVGTNLFPAGPVGVALQYAATVATNDVAGSRRDDGQYSIQLAAALPRMLRTPGRWFLRFAAQSSDATFAQVGLSQRNALWTMDSGLTLTLGGTQP